MKVSQILRWADAHLKRTSRWPMLKSGLIGAVDSGSLSWRSIDYALLAGARGLPGRTTLAKLLAKHRDKPLYFYRARLANREIVRLAALQYRETGSWPQKHSGRVRGAPDRTWGAINATLVRYGDEKGRRLSLSDLLQEGLGKRNLRRLPPLSVEQLLAWVDAHKQRTAVWPTRHHGGRVYESPADSWYAIDDSLRHGRRSLPNTGGLSAFLDQHRNVRNVAAQPPVTRVQILAWADAHHQRTGTWPTNWSGPVHGVLNENWMAINGALTFGRRGLRTRVSLAKFLAKFRGKRNARHPPRLSRKIILKWADHHYHQTGDWPSRQSGNVLMEPQERWSAVNESLYAGRRGLPGGSTLAKVLGAERPEQFARRGIPLKRSQILDWAAAHHELTGRLPTRESGQVRYEPGEHWHAVDAALHSGTRGLRGGSSLEELLASHYVPAHPQVGRRLSERRIIGWAEAFRRRVGQWPTARSAFTDSNRRERWIVVDLALREGHRGLPGGSSLARLLSRHRRAAASKSRSIWRTAG